MRSRLQEINDAFKNNGIILKEKLDDTKKYPMQESITNQFMKIEDIHGNKYLIRLNGKLWPPFTRENENYNLNQLRENNINTNVIVNNYKVGFQICHLNEEENRFSEAHINKRLYIINKIGYGIKKIHKMDNFKNQYAIAQTIDNSLNKVPDTAHKNILPYHTLILSITYTISSDQKNIVSSHNDLLPSSIYINKKNISFVDWEYSAENHRSYDLALFSIKSYFSSEEENILISAYDSKDDLDMKYYVSIMKPIVNYLLLLWNFSSKNTSHIISNALMASLNINIQDAIYRQSSRTWKTEMKLSLFYKKNTIEKSISHEKLSKNLKLTNGGSTYAKN